MYRIQVIAFFMIISYVELTIHPQGNFQKRNFSNEKQLDSDHSNQKILVINLKESDSEKEELKVINSNITTNNNSVVTHNSSNHTATSNVHEEPKVISNLEEKDPNIESGAIRRAMLVFVGISFFFILYVGLQTYRRRKQDKSRTIVRKYGVRTHRTDLEMEPLPLSDDDEDDTIFDLTANRSTSN